MRGDILIIGAQHRKAAAGIATIILPGLSSTGNRYLVAIAGESGAGKSEIAYALSQVLESEGVRAYIIQQDDFFKYPPKTNARVRENDLGHVGPGEVRIDLLDHIMSDLSQGATIIRKPLVIFDEDRITEESIDLRGFPVVIVEGTYTSLLRHVHCRVFIDRDYQDTREDRMKRNREKQDAYLEQILEIEHNIISRHKEQANIIISRDFEAFLP
jgi:uridine kinase